MLAFKLRRSQFAHRSDDFGGVIFVATTDHDFPELANDREQFPRAVQEHDVGRQVQALQRVDVRLDVPKMAHAQLVELHPAARRDVERLVRYSQQCAGVQAQRPGTSVVRNVQLRREGWNFPLVCLAFPSAAS